jgi:hypothetical protein
VTWKFFWPVQENRSGTRRAEVADSLPRLSSDSEIASRFDAARLPSDNLGAKKCRNDENSAEISTVAEALFIGMDSAMLRIEKISEETKTTLHLSGRIQAEHLIALQMEREQIGLILAFDLREIQLVDDAAVRFLAECESDGVILLHCPAYIREWIRRERESK